MGSSAHFEDQDVGRLLIQDRWLSRRSDLILLAETVPRNRQTRSQACRAAWGLGWSRAQAPPPLGQDAIRAGLRKGGRCSAGLSHSLSVWLALHEHYPSGWPHISDPGQASACSSPRRGQAAGAGASTRASTPGSLPGAGSLSPARHASSAHATVSAPAIQRHSACA